MKRYALWVAVFAFLAALLPVAPAAAQGVTSAAVSGRLTDESHAPVEQAVVNLINTSNGQRYSTRSTADGRFYFENAQVGGPYTLEVDRKSTRLNSSHPSISYAVFCLKKK